MMSCLFIIGVDVSFFVCVVVSMFPGNHIISRSYENHSIITLLTVHTQKKIDKQLCVIKQGNCQILWWVN